MQVRTRHRRTWPLVGPVVRTTFTVNDKTLAAQLPSCLEEQLNRERRRDLIAGRYNMFSHRPGISEVVRKAAATLCSKMFDLPYAAVVQFSNSNHGGVLTITVIYSNPVYGTLEAERSGEQFLLEFAQNIRQKD